MRFLGRCSLVFVVVCLVLVPARSEASMITLDQGTLSSGSFGFSGTFTADNDIALIYFALPTTASFSVQITSNLTGTPPGFDPYLSLLTSGGTDFLGFGYLADQESGLPNTLASGSYLLALTQYDNRFTPGSGFDYDADPLFTLTLATIFGVAVPGGCQGFLAIDFIGSATECRTGSFAGSLVVQTATAPEPGSLSLLALGATAWIARQRRRRGRAA